MNKKAITFEEQKRISLEILKNVAEFCDNHGLQYFLAYGTLLGAVRHKGYIPWDDDIDIQMPRADYNKLIEIFNSEKTVGYYKLIAPTDKSARHTFVKVTDTRTIKLEPEIDYSNGMLGVDIDIFPIDGQPQGDEQYDKWYHALIRLYSLHYLFVIDPKKTMKRKIVLPLLNLLTNKEKVLKRAQKLHAKYPYDSSEYVGTIESNYNIKQNRHKKELFSEVTMLKFEDTYLKAPTGYDEILTTLYGNYMVPPKNQTTHHINEAYWIES